MGKPFVVRPKRATQSPALLRRGGGLWGWKGGCLTAETSEQAGGQDSPLSDGCFLLALIDQRQSPLQCVTSQLNGLVTNQPGPIVSPT